MLFENEYDPQGSYDAVCEVVSLEEDVGNIDHVVGLDCVFTDPI